MRSGLMPSAAAKFSLLVLAALVSPQASAAEYKPPVLASFAHPDDERIVGPLLHRLVREGREVHLVIATDGSKGVRDYARIPAGPELAAARVKEAECAAQRLGVQHLHMIGMQDGSLGGSIMTMMELRTKLKAVIDQVKPGVILTFGPEGGTGHPDHRLIGNATTEIVQADDRHRTTELYYAELPAERMRTAPPSIPRVSSVAEDLLTVRVPVTQQDLVAGHESFACHKSQYTEAEMAAINKTLDYARNGVIHLRPWNGPVRKPTAPFLP